MERQRARDARKAARAARREGRLVVAPPEYFPG